MLRKKIGFSVLIALLFISSQLMAMTGKEVMIKVDEESKNSYTSTIQKVKLSTCKVGKKGKKIVCAQKPRVKVLESIQKDSGVDGKDSQGVSIVLQPSREKGVGMLSYQYDDENRDTDTWLYLSALGKIKRMISGSGDDEDGESSSFFGSEFYLEDMESQKIDAYTYKILKETTYQKRPVWIIESKPTAKQARKTKYSKVINWIDKERYISLKAQMYDRHGKLHKRLTIRNVKKIDGVWIARKLTIHNFKSNRVSNMNLQSLAFNVDVPNEFLTQRTLTDYTFRERELSKLRKHLK